MFAFLLDIITREKITHRLEGEREEEAGEEEVQLIEPNAIGSKTKSLKKKKVKMKEMNSKMDCVFVDEDSSNNNNNYYLFNKYEYKYILVQAFLLG